MKASTWGSAPDPAATVEAAKPPRRGLFAACCILFAALFALGCDSAASNVAGTNDVELTYEIIGAPVQEQGFGNDLRALVLQRVGGAQIGADVTEEYAADRPPRVRLVVDEALGPRVDELVTWTGTLLFFDVDRTAPLPTPPTSAGLTQAGTNGETWYEGTRAQLLRAIETWSIDKDHRIVAEAVPTSKDGLTVAKWRTRVLKSTAIGELGDGALVGWGGGPSVRVRGESNSIAAKVIAEAASHPQLVIVRGHISLGEPGFEANAIHIDFGEGAGAYARARRERFLLGTPRLPPLRRIEAVGLPPNRGLMIACLIVPILLSFAWIVFVRRFDRAHPEPMWLIGVTFLFGAISTLPAATAEELLAGSTKWLDPNLVTYGGQSFAFPLSFAVFTLVVGFSEEGCKRLAAQFALRRPEFDEPIDGIVYGIVASLGFAAAENIRYFAIGRMSAPVIIGRCFMSIPAHMFFGALWGYALGQKLVEPKTKTWAWLVLAAVCHGLFDALLSTDGAELLAVLLNVGLASVFVALVRKALRHGPVTPEQLAMTGAREYFFVGRAGLFWLSAICLHVLAFFTFVLGAYYQLSRHRPSLLFVGGSTALLALLILAALGVAATLPLDVAIDDWGITFGGATRPWRKIRAYKIVQKHIEVECEGGPLLLGPAPAETLAEIAVALVPHLGEAGGGDRAKTLESRR